MKTNHNIKTNQIIRDIQKGIQIYQNKKYRVVKKIKEGQRIATYQDKKFKMIITIKKFKMIKIIKEVKKIKESKKIYKVTKII